MIERKALMPDIRHFRELEVYQLAIESAMRIFEVSKLFPAEEKYSLPDQIRRSSRSVCANIADGHD
jgi:four helix bundle protein